MRGMRSVALGINNKVIASGKCNHPNKRKVNKEYLKDGLPIPGFAWTHCIFCCNDDCVFGGNCKYKKKESVLNNE